MNRKIDHNTFQTSEKRINTRPAACGHGKVRMPPAGRLPLPAAGLYLSARLLRFSFRPFIRVNQAAGDVKKTMDFFRRVRPQRTNLCPCISAEHTDRHTTCSPYPVYRFSGRTEHTTKKPDQAASGQSNQTQNCAGYGLHSCPGRGADDRNLKGP